MRPLTDLTCGIQRAPLPSLRRQCCSLRRPIQRCRTLLSGPSLGGRVLLTQLTKHVLLEKGEKEGCGTAGLAAGVNSIAVAKKGVALSEYRRLNQLAAAWFYCASCNARTPC